MINLRVDDLDGIIATLKGKGIEILGRQDEDYGNFAWILDCDGIKVELWEQMARRRPGRSSTAADRLRRAVSRALEESESRSRRRLEHGPRGTAATRSGRSARPTGLPDERQQMRPELVRSAPAWATIVSGELNGKM